MTHAEKEVATAVAIFFINAMTIIVSLTLLNCLAKLEPTKICFWALFTGDPNKSTVLIYQKIVKYKDIISAWRYILIQYTNWNIVWIWSYLPGQGNWLQLSSLVNLSILVNDPWTSQRLWHERVWIFSPPPQLTEQIDHAVHCVYSFIR